MKSLENVIRRYVKLGRPNNRGWFPCVHKGCDHGRKGPRAAFLFGSDGEVGFNCFNCGSKISFHPDTQKSFPKNLKKIFQDFGVPKNEWKSIELELFVADKANIDNIKKKIKNITPKELIIPQGIILLKELPITDKWAQVAYAYLESRKLDPDSYPFMISKKMNHKWAKRLIIPFYMKNKLVYYTGRDLTGSAKKKYENPMADRDNIIFNFDYLFDYTDNPLYVVEGVIDALSIPDCVAILGNEITPGQIEWLDKSRRDKIYIPDRKKGKVAADKAVELGWSISTPKIGDCNDVNDAVVEYGRLYVIKSIVDNVRSGQLAKISAGLYCES